MATANVSALRALFEAIRDERRLHANTATRIGEAFLSLLSYLDDAPFLRKDKEDSTDYLLRLLAGAVIGEARQIKLNPDGSIVCGSIKVNGAAIFDDLVINKQTVNSGDQIFSDRGIVERVEHTDLYQYDLYIRKEYEQEVTTFKVNDVVKMTINNLDADGTFFTSWVRVNAVDTANNVLTVILYPDDGVPGGINHAPVAPGVLARWGNATDPDRQQSFYLSALDGRFVFLQGVTKPIVEDTNTAAFIGLPPDMEILKDLPLNTRQPYVYARGLIVQDIVRVDYQGNPIYEIRDRGNWQATSQYVMGYDEEAEAYYQDQVWHNGSCWRCVVEKATVGSEPTVFNTDWACVMGNGNYMLSITSTAGNFFRAGTTWQTTLVSSLYHGEYAIPEDKITSVVWTRESTEAASDEAWNTNQAKKEQSMSLNISSDSDLPPSWELARTVGFRVTVTLDNEEKLSTSYKIS